MPRSLADQAVADAISGAQAASRDKRTKTVLVDGTPRVIPTPFPSPGDWRDCPMYFLMLDRFNNPSAPPRGTWNRKFNFRQGGTFEGVRAQLGYLEDLGVRAIWLSPVLKNSRPDSWEYNYHGYGAQDFLNVDERFGSDGTRATAERELIALVDEAHARGIYVILDIVLNHTARVFDYVANGGTQAILRDSAVMDGPLGSEPPVQWLNGLGFPRSDWQNRLDAPASLSDDDAVWPVELQNHLFYRRRGSKLTDKPDARGFVRGDFDSMRQLAVEYDAAVPGQEPVRAQLGPSPVLNVLVRAHAYLIAKYDFDGFRLDTVKYVDPEAIETFGNAIREYALSTGKKNFFTFGEVYDNEETIAKFIGRNGGSGEGFGLDAALDFPLFYILPSIAKGQGDVAELRNVFARRKEQEKELLSSHGEAGRFFVSFLDNHDQPQRFKHPLTPDKQVVLGYALLFALQGIPCLYYGSEQALSGTVDGNGSPELNSNESTREAMWGKPGAFSTTSTMFREVQRLAKLRHEEPALSFGRLYFREVSGNRVDFGHSSGAGGIVAFSRILGDREVLVVANTGAAEFKGSVVVDADLLAGASTVPVVYSNENSVTSAPVRSGTFNFWRDGIVSRGTAAAVDVRIGVGEVQVLARSTAAAPLSAAGGR